MRHLLDALDVALFSVDIDGTNVQEIVTATADHCGQMMHLDVLEDGPRLVYSACNYESPSYRPPPITREAKERRVVEEYDLDQDATIREEDLDVFTEAIACNSSTPRYSYEIAVSNLDGTDIRRLTANDGYDNYPSWSPDGKRIAYLSSDKWSQSNRPDYPRQIAIVAADGSERSYLSIPGLRPDKLPLAWSPDGQRIAFAAYEGPIKPVSSELNAWGREPVEVRAVYVVGIDDSGLTRISDSLSQPVWSPDGRKIALVRPGGNGVSLVTVNPDGSDPREIVEITSMEDFEYPFGRYVGNRYESPAYDYPCAVPTMHTLAWSPDGTHIMYTCDGGVCIADLKGEPVGQSPFGPVASWSPDGSRVAVRATVDLSHKYGMVLAYTMNPDGSDIHILVRVDAEGVVAEHSGWRDVMTAREACSGGYVVPRPEAFPGLVSDCETLITVRDDLAGFFPVLNWGPELPIQEWEGVQADSRVRRLDIASVENGHPYGFDRREPGAVPESGQPSYGTELQMHEVYRDGIRHDELSGFIPPELVELTALEELLISGHSLKGGIPREIGQLSGLRILDLSHSRLTGPIPRELGRLSKLEILNLSGNHLEGDIPPRLGQLEHIQYLNLSDNELSGTIPQSWFAREGSPSKPNVLIYGNELVGCIPLQASRLWTEYSDLGWCRE